MVNLIGQVQEKKKYVKCFFRGNLARNGDPRLEATALTRLSLKGAYQLLSIRPFVARGPVTARLVG